MQIGIRFAAVAIFAFASLPAQGASWTDSPRALVILDDAAPGPMKDFVRLLETEGGHASVILSPKAAVVIASDGLLAKPAFSGWILQATGEPIDDHWIGSRSGEIARAARVWNEFLNLRRITAPEDPHGHSMSMMPDAGPVRIQLGPAPRDISRDAPTHIPYGAEYYDTSAYMAGSTAVGVWLLEAAGPTYDWSQAEEDQTIAGVVAGLDDWVGFGSTMAFLTFVLDVHTDVPVSGVPIENPQSMEGVWIGEALANAGWLGANAFERCFAYNNALRDAAETNWCFSYFIVDSDPTVNQGLFSGGGYAWAYFGGPWIYMSRHSTWAFNSQNYFEAVPMHEAGHIYYATDEYDGVQQFNGYLNVGDNPSTTVFCIMNQNLDTIVCGNSKRQIAWRDPDTDGIMDPLDTEPTCSLNPSLPDPTSDPTPTWTGRAQVTTIPNLCPISPYDPAHDITVSTITNVECRIDGGAWLPAAATDGMFDAYGEDYTFTSPPLAPGVHLVEARARNSVGIWNSVFSSDTITITGVTDAGDLAQVSGRLDLRTSGSNPGLRGGGISMDLPEEGWVRLDVVGVNGGRVRTLIDGMQPRGRSEHFWNGANDHGELVPAGVYFYRLVRGNEEKTAKFTLLR
jgi:hypothetical protein